MFAHHFYTNAQAFEDALSDIAIAGICHKLFTATSLEITYKHTNMKRIIYYMYVDLLGSLTTHQAFDIV